MSQDYIRSLPEHEREAGTFGLRRLHIDPVMFILIVLVAIYGLFILYSAVGQSDELFTAQLKRILFAFVVMIGAAQLPPQLYMRWAPFIYVAGVILLLAVLWMGVTVNGSQRWLDIPGLIRFQPSELMKIAVPMAVAWYFHSRPLPPSFKDVAVAVAIVAIPAACIMNQPDLGTGILVICAGLAVVFFAGLSWRWMLATVAVLAAAAPGIWLLLKDYQRQRIQTLFDPETDPLGAGWNIMQSTTAIGSGGLFGKGWLQGTQSQLDFLPEARTDFIIAVVAEELGFVGVTVLLILYLLLIARGLFLAAAAESTFGRLLSGALMLTFFVYFFVNIAMVSGLLPVVGVPLPLVSYGGTSVLTLMAGFGILMAVRSHKAW
ncbi:MAG: rod shape-determining protein RodA [Gammaproteobacteria bacterium]|jgi:rod shape determining protein RodA|nr:rod shape-determining protein RodA [Gammaproteobacteria bacterium]MCH1551617.1 rod shape-determining protein RodA [Pseudomonadales bacterium]